MHDDDPVGREEGAAHSAALAAALATVDGDATPAADSVRKKFTLYFTFEPGASDTVREILATHAALQARALAAAREAVLAMRASEEIGDDAFHRIEEKLDWLATGPQADGHS